MLNPYFPPVDLPILEGVEPPLVKRVRIPQPRAEAIQDLEGTIGAHLREAVKVNRLPPGSSIAVGVGSRGIAHLPRLVKSVIDYLKSRELEPFIVPAMGSHGGATAEGQVSLLAGLGVTEDTVGAPIRASMEVIETGRTPTDFKCLIDARAMAADGIVIIARVKPHTSFNRPIESGLVKMMAIGLGKQAGATAVHNLGPAIGLGQVLPAIGRVLIEKAPLVCGLAVVENADHEVVHLEAVEPDNFFAADERLLKLAKSTLARLPFDQIDVLIVEELGKEISGCGMDYAVTGRTDIRGIPNPLKPLIYKVAVLGCTTQSHGNATGIGMADYIPRSLANKVDLVSFYMNSITASITEKARFPIVLNTDEDVVKACTLTSWRATPIETRLCLIRNTLELNDILLSQPLLEDIEGHEGVEVLSELFPLSFDDDGVLLSRI